MDQLFGQDQTAAFGIDLTQPGTDCDGRITAGYDLFDNHAARGIAKGQSMIFRDHAFARRVGDDGRA